MHTAHHVTAGSKASGNGSSLGWMKLSFRLRISRTAFTTRTRNPGSFGDRLTIIIVSCSPIVNFINSVLRNGLCTLCRRADRNRECCVRPGYRVVPSFPTISRRFRSFPARLRVSSMPAPSSRRTRSESCFAFPSLLMSNDQAAGTMDDDPCLILAFIPSSDPSGLCCMCRGCTVCRKETGP